MNISKIKPILEAAKIADDTVLMVGAHGIGKSDIVKSYANENNMGIKTIFLSMFEVGDLLGMPNIENGTTVWAEPDWLMELNEMAWPEHFNIEDLEFQDKEFEEFVKNVVTIQEMTKKELTKLYNEFYGGYNKNVLLTNQLNVSCKKSKHTVLFTDEYSRAQVDVHNACLQLVLERKLHNHILPFTKGKQTQIIAADNPGDGEYHVNTLDPATKDRFIELEVEADPEDWLKWARENNVNKIVRDFIIDNPTKLHFMPEEGSGQQGASPRSWTKLAQYIDQFEQNLVPEELHLNIVYGKIGPAIGAQFYTFYMNYSNNISLEDIEKFIKKSYKKTNDVNESAKELSEFMENVESISKLEHINTLFDRDKEKISAAETTYDDLISIFVLLTSFEIETLTSFLKDKKANDKKAFYDLMKKDSKRELARKIKNKVKQ